MFCDAQRPMSGDWGVWVVLAVCACLSWLTASTARAETQATTAAESGSGSAANEPTRHWTFGFRVGVDFSQTRDEVLSPLSYRGVQLVVGAAFAHERGQNRHQAQLELLPGYKVDRFGYGGIFLTQRLDYRYLRTPSETPSAASRIAIGAGAALVLDPVLYADASTDYPYWQTIYDVRAAARLEHPLSHTQALEVDAALSVLGTGSRPPVERFDVGEFGFSSFYTESHTDFRFLSFHNHFYLELRPCFRHHGRGAGSQAVCYELGVRWLKDPLPIVTLDNRVDYTFWF